MQFPAGPSASELPVDCGAVTVDTATQVPALIRNPRTDGTSTASTLSAPGAIRDLEGLLHEESSSPGHRWNRSLRLHLAIVSTGLQR